MWRLSPRRTENGHIVVQSEVTSSDVFLGPAGQSHVSQTHLIPVWNYHKYVRRIVDKWGSWYREACSTLELYHQLETTATVTYWIT